MAKKIKVEPTLEKYNSWNDVDVALGKYATNKALVEKKKSEYNAWEQEQRAKLQAELVQYEEAMKTTEQSIKKYAEDHRADFDGKTMRLTHGLLQFRYAKHAVKTLKGFTFASALELIKRSTRLTELFVRVKEELDKEAIGTSWALWSNTAEGQDLPANAVSEDELAEVGLQLVQEESFYIEPHFAVEE